MEMPEPTQWDNEDSENTTAVELKDFLDSVPYIQSRKTPKGRMKTNFDYRHCDSRPIFLKFNYRELIVFFFMPVLSVVITQQLLNQNSTKDIFN
jgi:hypothetical protein